jgi:hypothetical protein
MLSMESMGTASNSLVDPYEYMCETNIDDELKCSICTQPLQTPVCLSCSHTFCRECIELWFTENVSCPTCRRSPVPNDNDHLPYSPVNTHIVNNQLDRLLVQCSQCHEVNIPRGHFLVHQSRCAKRLVSCSSADIQCSWRGIRDDLATHLSQCSFHQLRPIIDELRDQLEASRETQNELRQQLEKQSSHIDFLLAYVNRGNIMTKECSKAYGKCQYALRTHHRSKVTYHCTVCESIAQRRQASIHVCSLDEQIDCICHTCVEKQYPLPLEIEHDDNEEDS